MERQGIQSLQGKRVLISGGTTGIGRALVDMLVAEGAQVATFGRDQEDLQKLREAQPAVLAIQGDVSVESDVRSIVAQTVEKFGGLDALVNNSGVAGDSILETPYAEWRKVIETNLIGAMLLTQVSLEHLGKGTHIVTVGSMSAKTRDEGSDVYVASKSGLRGFVDSVGRGLGEKGVVHTLVEPGLAESDMTTEDKSAEEVEKSKAEDKMMDPEDVARMIVFALSQPAHIVISELQIRPRAQLI